LFGLFNIIWNLYIQSNLVIVLFNKYSHTLLWLFSLLLNRKIVLTSRGFNLFSIIVVRIEPLVLPTKYNVNYN
jgi:hypothetical protein